MTLAGMRVRDDCIALDPRHGVDILSRLPKALVLLQTSYQLGTRVFFVPLLARRTRQQKARFDFGQNRGHDQVFSRQLKLELVHQLDIHNVLVRDLRDRDVKNVEILATDQIEQQIKGALKRIENDFQSVRRDIQILRNLQHWLPTHECQRHFLLLWRRIAQHFTGGIGRICRGGIHARTRFFDGLNETRWHSAKLRR